MLCNNVGTGNKKQKKKRVDICISDSPYCTVETKTAL